MCRPSAPPAAGAEEAVGYRGEILEDLNRAGVNVRKYRNATLASFDGSEDPRALEAALAYVEAWPDPRKTRWAPRDWMFLYGAGSSRASRAVNLGKLGNGKTHLAIAIARELIERAVLPAKKFTFRTAETILLETEATFRPNSDDSEKDLLRRYEAPDLLLIDDLGIRHDWSAHAVRVFDELTKRREANGTIWTSNLSIPVLAGASQEMRRIADRIAGEVGDGARYAVEFRGPSWRQRRSKRPAA